MSWRGSGTAPGRRRARRCSTDDLAMARPPAAPREAPGRPRRRRPPTGRPPTGRPPRGRGARDSGSHEARPPARGLGRCAGGGGERPVNHPCGMLAHPDPVTQPGEAPLPQERTTHAQASERARRRPRRPGPRRRGGGRRAAMRPARAEVLEMLGDRYEETRRGIGVAGPDAGARGLRLGRGHLDGARDRPRGALVHGGLGPRVGRICARRCRPRARPPEPRGPIPPGPGRARSGQAVGPGGLAEASQARASQISLLPVAVSSA